MYVFLGAGQYQPRYYDHQSEFIISQVIVAKFIACDLVLSIFYYSIYPQLPGIYFKSVEGTSMPHAY